MVTEMTDGQETERFVFLLIEDFSHLAFANAIEPLRIANLSSGKTLYSWVLASEDGTRAVCSNRSVTLVDQGLVPLDRKDRLFVVSGIGAPTRGTPAVLDYLRREKRRGATIGAICSGAYILARTGLLDGQACAIHWEFHDAFAEEFPNVALRRNVFVADGPILTASGGPAAADLMLHLIARRHGTDLAGAVADQMVYNAVRTDAVGQRISVSARLGRRSDRLRHAVEIMEANLEDPLGSPELARRVGLSVRQLERLFGKYLHATPNKYYLELRLRRARNLIQQTDMAIIDVSTACGFGSQSTFSRSYKQFFGISPSEQRGLN